MRSFYVKQNLFRLYRNDNLKGGHVIMLGKNCENAAVSAIIEYPQGLQIGGE